MKHKLPGDEARDDGEDPHQDFEDVPGSSGIFIHYEGEAVSHYDHVRFCLAVWHWVLCEDQEVEEGDQVGHDQTGPRVLEIIAEAGVNLHPSEEAQTSSTWKTPDRDISVLKPEIHTVNQQWNITYSPLLFQTHLTFFCAVKQNERRFTIFNGAFLEFCLQSKEAWTFSESSLFVLHWRK